MKYLCLIYGDESHWAKMPKADVDKMQGEYGAFTGDIMKSGHYIGGNALQPAHGATSAV